MRATILGGIFLVSLSLTLILFLHPHDSFRPDLMIPEDALGLLVISNRLPNLDFVEHSRLGSDFGLDGKSLIRRIPKESREQLMALFEEELEAAWLVVHRLTGKPDGSWRIHFTGLLIPRPLRRESLKLRTEVAMQNLFGEGKTDLREHDSIRIYTGEESGQVLYQILLPEGLLISNSEEGWRKTLRTVAGREASLAEKPSFQRVRNHLQIETGFFIYFDARQLLSLLPEFGYLIRWEEGKWEEEYYEITDTDQGTQIDTD